VHGGVLLVLAALAHGGAGDWDEYAMLILAPLVIAAVLWVTRRPKGEEEEEE
jgi:hypothetical protein